MNLRKLLAPLLVGVLALGIAGCGSTSSDTGSAKPNKEKVGKINREQVREIATTKLPDLNANDVDAAMKIVEGTARSMGVTVEG